MAMEQHIQKQSPTYVQYFNSAAIGADINYDVNPVITFDEALHNVVEESNIHSNIHSKESQTHSKIKYTFKKFYTKNQIYIQIIIHIHIIVVYFM